MSYKVLLTHSAERDLEAIYDYIAENDTQANPAPMASGRAAPKYCDAEKNNSKPQGQTTISVDFPYQWLCSFSFSHTLISD